MMYCMAYVTAYATSRPLFRYYPVPQQWAWGAADGSVRPGPVIVWYGLVASSALIGGVGAVFLRDRWIAAILRNWLWVWPYAAVGACLFLLRPFFM